MSVRVHFAAAENVNAVGVRRARFEEALEPLGLEQLPDAPAVLVIEDPGNMEAFVVEGDQESLMDLCFAIFDAVRYGTDDG